MFKFLNLFKRDVTKILAIFSKLVVELETFVEKGKAEIKNIEAQLENKKNDVAIAEKAATNIKAIIS